MKSTPSSAPFLDSNRWAEATGTTDALRTLVRGVARARAFALFFAVVNKPWERDQLIAMLAEALPGRPLHRVELAADTVDVLAEIGRQAPQAGGPLLVVGLEKAVASDRSEHAILAALNLQRPQWPERVPQPVVFWVPHYVLGFLEREAPDFFDWRSDTIAFPELADEEVEHLRRFVWTPAVDSSLGVEARHARVEELRARLADSAPSEDPVARDARAGWLRELGNHQAFLGDWEAGLGNLRAALAIYEALGNKRSRAVTLGDIARLRADKGEMDQALQLHQERLGIFEALGDKRSRAVTLGDIARLRTAQGEADQALQLHQEKLAIMEALGDKRSQAITLADMAQVSVRKGDFADALTKFQEARDVFLELGDRRSQAGAIGDIARLRAAKGEVDQALQLHQEELAVYEALGDKRARAITLGDIARLRAAKGEVDQALQLHQETLAVYEDLDDKDAKANALWSIARIEIKQQHWQPAFQHLAESYAILLKLGRLDGICFVGSDLGQLLCEAGQREQGLAILARSRDGFVKLGQDRMAQQTQALIERIGQSPPAG